MKIEDIWRQDLLIGVSRKFAQSTRLYPKHWTESFTCEARWQALVSFTALDIAHVSITERLDAVQVLRENERESRGVGSRCVTNGSRTGADGRCIRNLEVPGYAPLFPGEVATLKNGNPATFQQHRSGSARCTLPADSCHPIPPQLPYLVGT